MDTASRSGRHKISDYLPPARTAMQHSKHAHNHDIQHHAPACRAQPPTTRFPDYLHRGNGETNIARATRRANHRPNDLIDAVTRSNPTTQ
jgi:hypothetical protein